MDDIQVPIDRAQLPHLTPAQIEKLHEMAMARVRFRCYKDPQDPTCILIEFRQLDVVGRPLRLSTGDAARDAGASFCVAYLVGLGLLPEQLAERMLKAIGPIPDSEPLG